MFVFFLKLAFGVHTSVAATWMVVVMVAGSIPKEKNEERSIKK